MSTKTNFKRIALVAVAALGMGVLSSVPSQATFLTLPTITVGHGTATKAKADSSTAGSITISWNADAATDTVTISAITQSYPADAGTTVPQLATFFGDTVGSTSAVGTPTGREIASGATYGEASVKFVPERAGESLTMSASRAIILTTVAGKNVIKLKPQIDTVGAVARFTGTYSYLIAVTPYSAGVKGTVVTATYNVVIAALDSESPTASSATSKSFISSSSSVAPTADSTAPVLATASTTAAAWVYVNLLNADSGQASESVTITTTIGNLGSHGGASVGKAITVAYNQSGAASYYPIFPDGTAGTAVITVKSASVTFANKSVTFYAANPTTLVARALNTTPGVGTNSSAVEVVAKDVNGNLWNGTLRIYSDTLGTISDTGTSCANANTVVGAFLCPVTGVTAGTAKVKAYAAAQTVASNEISLTVIAATAEKVKLSWDKASYAPGEKATLRVEVLDSASKPVQNAAYTNLFATGGISLSIAAGNGSDTLTNVSVTTTTPAQDYVGTSTTAAKLYTVYMPASGGTVTASATGGSSLPVAGQVKVSASATVTDSGAAALAAVTALATTVASLRTLITTLTNLVLKIQKKVKA